MAWSILYNGNETETMKIPRTRHIRFVSAIFHFDIIWRQNTVDRRTRRRRRVIGIRCDFRYRRRSGVFRPMRISSLDEK